MNRERLIKRLVERKMSSKDKGGAFCVCMVMKNAGQHQASSSGSKR